MAEKVRKQFSPVQFALLSVLADMADNLGFITVTMDVPTAQLQKQGFSKRESYLAIQKLLATGNLKSNKKGPNDHGTKPRTTFQVCFPTLAPTTTSANHRVYHRLRNQLAYIVEIDAIATADPDMTGKDPRQMLAEIAIITTRILKKQKMTGEVLLEAV